MHLGDRDNPFVRPTARVILLDSQDRVLLILATVTDGRDPRPGVLLAHARRAGRDGRDL